MGAVANRYLLCVHCTVRGSVGIAPSANGNTCCIKLHTEHYIVHHWHFTLHTMTQTPYISQCTFNPKHYTVHSVFYRLYNMQFILYIAVGTLHRVPFCHISLNTKDRFPARVILYALCHKKTENIFLEQKIWCFTPATRGLKNGKNPL